MKVRAVYGMPRRVLRLSRGLFLLLLVASFPVAAEDFPGEWSLNGWIWAEYGAGDRYSDADGEDSLGISEGALLGTWKYENVQAVLLLGGRNLTGDGSDGDFGIKDAFIIWDKIGGGALGLSAGVQPLFFGLKPNGFPGDRSLQPSLEFGGAGGFAVSQQAGPSVILHLDAGKRARLSGGAFDTSSTTAAYFAQTGLGSIDGSTIEKNYFVQLEFGSKESGFYGVLGYEERYVGGAVDSSKPIVDVGLGFKGAALDLSVEVIQLDRTLTLTPDDEVYTIAELTITPNDRLGLLLDYAEAEEAQVETLRAGLTYRLQEPLLFHLEFSEDDFGDGNTVDSVDVRLEFNF